MLFRSTFARLRPMGFFVHGVFLPIYYQPASLILSQADAMGYTPTFFGVDGMDGILTAENFDASLAEGVYQMCIRDRYRRMG